MSRILALAAAAFLGGCTVGPHHFDPHPSLPSAAAAGADLSPITPASGPAQTLTLGEAPPADWWTRLGSAKLDALVARALAANNDIAAADASLRQVQEQAAAALGTTRPQLDASYQAQRIRTSRIYSNPLQNPDNYEYTLHTAQVTVAYPLDLFGAGRNRLASARAAADVQRYRRLAARTTVAANLALAVVTHAALAAQAASANDSVRANREVLGLLLRRQQLGAIGAADVTAQQTALANAEATVPPLTRQLAHQEALIAALIGQAPGNPLPPLPSLAELHVPADLPVALPADLVRHRPDIRSAEAQMRGAAADVGSAIAARLPQIQLTASVGGIAEQFGQMFAAGHPFWTLVGGITQPLFHGGQLLHQQRAAQAALAGSQAQYRGAVIQAFVDVSDALTGLHTDAVALDAAARADTAAARELTFITRQLQLGDVGTLNLLNATASRAQAASQLTQARAARLSDSIALFQALGGGW